MLSNRALGVQRQPARASQWQLVGPTPAGRARRGWRIVLDKLFCVLQWAHWQEVVSAWLPLPELSQRPSRQLTREPTSSTAASSSKLAPTDKGAAYKRYLQERNPEELSSVKGIPQVPPERCQHPSQCFT